MIWIEATARWNHTNIVESIATVITKRPLFSVIDVQAVTSIVT